ncbi:CBS domain-containing protein [Calditerrivibrio nitroreducens]|uniref:CBS domain containing protein n=1 Tax=Calditerrivibrio nitroreducens (strain DSM 19672 / NBRC 101217 / Yu37-1) TaxID=768670 RepID=E4TF94_CALNY|nr:CBS domain-containing protein [Calditerrivibrio nitroreducens]ADR18433.1 CBS domain containing protein [Calditerrivibrio nitroreducens DSM 19672]
MKAKDIMSPFNGVALDPEMGLKEAVEFMSSYKKNDGTVGVKGMLVMNGDKVVGTLSMEDVLRSVIPFYINPLLSDFTWEGMLLNMASRMCNKKVKEIMNKNLIFAEQDDSLMECAEKLIKYNLQRLPVVEKGKVVGIILIRDLYNVVINKILGRLNGNTDGCGDK